MVICISFLVLYYILKGSKVHLNHLKIKNDITYIDDMNGIEFEKYLQHLYKKNGYRANTTPKTGDFGADLVLYRAGEKTVVQAKRYKSKVGIDAVQEVIGAREYYGANKGIVVTSSYFTPQAVKLANRSNVKLIDRDMLPELIEGCK